MTTSDIGARSGKNNTTRFVGERRAKGIRELSGGGAIDLSGRVDYRGRRQQGGHRQTLKGLGSGVMEIALPYRGNAFRVVYAVQLGEDVWVVQAFQKKSTQGIKTPKHEIDLISERMKRLKEMLR
jgi:phage-related protein